MNFHTVRKAYTDLETEGPLRCEQGKGTFVNDSAGTLTRGHLRDTIRNHVHRLVEDLAGADVDGTLIEEMTAAELRRALRRGGHS